MFKDLSGIGYQTKECKDFLVAAIVNWRYVGLNTGEMHNANLSRGRPQRGLMSAGATCYKL